MVSRDRERELPFLAGIAGVLRWCEELANILSGPLLTAGLAIALIDLLTDGALLTAQPALLYAWAVSQAVGVDAQLVGAWDKAHQALRARRAWSLVGLLVLGGALAYVGYLAAIVFAMQQSAGITTAQALAQLGMDNATWLVSRAALSVVLVCLSGWTRYHPPAVASVEEEAAKLQRELTLEPLRAQVRMRKALGWRDVGRSIIAGNTAPALLAPPTTPPTPQEQEGAGMAEHGKTMDATSDAPEAVQRDVRAEDGPPEKPPTGGGTPARKPRVRTRRTRKGSKAPAVLRLTPESSERRIRAVLEADPGASIKTIAKRAQVGTSTASKWRAVIRANEQTEQTERAAQ